MTLAAAAFLVLGFLFLLQRLRVPARARDTFAVTGNAVAVMRDPALGELEKEKAVQAAARRLLVQFVILVVSTAAALAIPLAVVVGLAATGLFAVESVLDATMSWPVLAGATLVALVWASVARKPDE